MSLDKMGQEPIQQGVNRSDSITGFRWLAWAKDWAVLSIAVATVVALIGIAVAAMIFAMSERKQLAELRSRTDDRLTTIDRELAALGGGLGKLLASDEASKPDFPKRFLDLLNDSVKRAWRNDDPILAIETAAAIARKARELKLDADPQMVGTVARGFLRLVDDETLSKTQNERSTAPTNERVYGPAMEAVGELIGYRSSLLPNPLGQAEDGALVHSAMLKLPKFHSFKPLDSASRIIGSFRSLATDAGKTAAKIDLLNRPEPILSEDYRALVVEGYDVTIDGLDARNVLFSNSKITYSGGQLAMENVYFSNCTFQIAVRGGDFAIASLSPSGQVGLIKR
jgi:hypothetical protein